MREVIITPRAQRQLRNALEWWLKHREKAPHAFNEDIARGLLTIAEQPLLGTRIPERPGVRKLFLRRIGYSIYYRISTAGSVEVLAVWHHSRGVGPSL